MNRMIPAGWNADPQITQICADYRKLRVRWQDGVGSLRLIVGDLRKGIGNVGITINMLG